MKAQTVREKQPKSSSNSTNPIISSPTRKKTLRFVFDIILSSCADTTTHGISPIIKRDNLIIRSVWIVCFLASSIVCSYLTTLDIMTYLEYETVSKTNKIRLFSTEFPAVTICNTNPFLTNESLEFVNKLLIKSKLLDTNKTTLESLSSVTSVNIFYNRYYVGTNALDPALNDTFRKSLGLGIEQMIFSCAYDFKNCSSDEFSWFFDIYYGNCYTFNSGKSYFLI